MMICCAAAGYCIKKERFHVEGLCRKYVYNVNIFGVKNLKFPISFYFCLKKL